MVAGDDGGGALWALVAVCLVAQHLIHARGTELTGFTLFVVVAARETRHCKQKRIRKRQHMAKQHWSRSRQFPVERNFALV